MSHRYIILSVWTGDNHYYSRLGSVIVTFDVENCELNCKCHQSRRIACVHKSIAKWFLFTISPSLNFGTGSEKSAYSGPIVPFFDLKLEHSLCKMAGYESCKLMRLNEVHPKERFDENLVIVPKKETCQIDNCGGLLYMEDAGKKNSKLLTRRGVIIIRKVWKKVCAKCSMEYWYNDVSEGIFNYNNQFFMSIELLKWICNSLFLSVAISKEISLLEMQYDINLNHDLARKCFYKFIVKSHHEFKCLLCGYYPVVINFDVNRKCAFKLNESDHLSAGSHYVDYEKFWETIRSMVLFDSYGVTIANRVPSVHFWAPHILNEAKAEKVLNTEFMKGNGDDVEQKYFENLSEENLEELLQDADLKTLKNICKDSGIDAASSTRIGCIMKLKTALKDRVQIDKFFY